MKYLFVFCLSIFCLFSCGDSEDLCEDAPAACKDVVPEDEACLAFFMRWFYDENTHSCNQVAYSGCSQVGFTTEVECMECDCN